MFGSEQNNYKHFKFKEKQQYKFLLFIENFFKHILLVNTVFFFLNDLWKKFAQEIQNSISEDFEKLTKISN